MSHPRMRLPILALAVLSLLPLVSPRAVADAPPAATTATPSIAPQPAAPEGYPEIPGVTSQFGDFRGQFVSLTDPHPIPADQLTELGDDEEVLGVSLGGEERAYPARFIAWHHIVNDTLGAQPVCVSYCVVCNSGMAYNPMLDGVRHLFEVYGIYRGVMAMYDKSTNTVWAHLTGEALLGPDAGKTLEAYPMVNTTWGEWKRLHPHSTTPAWDAQFARYYRRKVVSGYGRVPKEFMPTIHGWHDIRLYANDLVLAVRVGSKQRAYPFKSLANADVVQEMLGKTPVAVLFQTDTQTGAAFDRTLDNEILDLHRVPGAPGIFQDARTCSTWNIEGVAVAGPLAGKKLKPLFYLQAEWYGWSAFYPETSIYEPTP